MLKLVDSINLKFIDINRKRSNRFSDIRDSFVQWLRLNTFIVDIRVRFPYGLIYLLINRGYSLIGKTLILHIINLGSIPNFSIFLLLNKLNWLSITLKMFGL